MLFRSVELDSETTFWNQPVLHMGGSQAGNTSADLRPTVTSWEAGSSFESIFPERITSISVRDTARSPEDAQGRGHESDANWPEDNQFAWIVPPRDKPPPPSLQRTTNTAPSTPDPILQNDGDEGSNLQGASRPPFAPAPGIYISPLYNASSPPKRAHEEHSAFRTAQSHAKLVTDVGVPRCVALQVERSLPLIATSDSFRHANGSQIGRAHV